jgi:Family of unknown function (DUF5652)
MKTTLPPQLSDVQLLLLIVLLLWSVAIKGVALYRAGALKSKGWFVVLFLINTVGLLDLYYLLVASKKAK